MKDRTRKLGRRALVALVLLVLGLPVGLEVIYLVGANLALSSGWLEKRINSKPEKLAIHWQGARTWVPGVVHADGLRLRGQDRSIQWFARVDRVGVWIDLPALFHREFQAWRVRADGLGFRLRRRLPAGGTPPTGPEGARLTPEIPGLENPPRPPPEELYPAHPRRHRPWAIDLGDLAIDGVREIWVERGRFRGDGHLEGNVRFEIGGPINVDRALVHLEDGELLAGKEALAKEVSLRLRVHLGPVTPRRAHLVEVLRRLRATVDVDARRVDLGVLSVLFRHAPWLELGGEGHFQAHLESDEGRLLPGSRLQVDASRLQAAFLDDRVRGAGRIEGDVKADRDPRGRLAVRLDRFTLERRGEKPHIHGEGFRLVATTREVDLAAGFPDLGLDLDLPRARVSDMAYYNAYLPPGSGFSLHSAPGTIEGHLTLPPGSGTGHGRIRLAAPALTMSFRDMDFTGDLAMETHLARADLARRRFDLGGSRLSLTDAGAGSRGGSWWGRVDVPEADLDLAAAPRLRARLDVAMASTAPMVQMLEAKKPILSWIDGLLTVHDLRGHGEIEADGDAFTLEGLRLTSKSLDARARMRLGKPAPRVLFYVEYGPLSVAMKMVGGEKDWKLFHSKRWYEAQTLAP